MAKPSAAIHNQYLHMMRGEQQRIFYKGSNAKINALITLIYPSIKIKFNRKTERFIEKQSNWLTLIFLPKRSPNLNPVETRVNRNLKKDICANHDYETEENLIKEESIS